MNAEYENNSCLVSYFITKPQHDVLTSLYAAGCLVSYFITKPQPAIRKLLYG